MGKRHRQTGLIRKHVDKSTAHGDGIAHTESLQRGSEQHAGADRPRQLEIVRNDQVVDDSL